MKKDDREQRKMEKKRNIERKREPLKAREFNKKRVEERIGGRFVIEIVKKIVLPFCDCNLVFKPQSHFIDFDSTHLRVCITFKLSFTIVANV